MKIKKYLSDLKHMKKQTHYLKILRGILGAIPVIGFIGRIFARSKKRKFHYI